MKPLGLMIVCGVALVSSATAQPAAKDPVQEAWTRYMQPSAAHEKLRQFVGSWNAEVTIWVAPSAPAQKYALSASAEMILGGRFHQTTFSGAVAGVAFEEIAQIGFNNASQKFTRTSLTNFGTGILIVEGAWQEPDRVIELRGKTTNPVTKATIEVRQRLTFVDADNIVLESFDRIGSAAEIKTTELRLSRKKPEAH